MESPPEVTTPKLSADLSLTFDPLSDTARENVVPPESVETQGCIQEHSQNLHKGAAAQIWRSY